MHLFIELDQWRQILAFASMDDDERATLLASLIDSGNEILYQRAARGFNFLDPSRPMPRVDLAELRSRPGWKMSLDDIALLRRVDLVARIQGEFGVLDPIAEIRKVVTRSR